MENPWIIWQLGKLRQGDLLREAELNRLRNQYIKSHKPPKRINTILKALAEFLITAGLSLKRRYPT